MINFIKNIEQNFSVSKAAFIVGFFALISRLTGLLRDRLFASQFGAGDTLDAYYAAFRVPDFIFNLLILGTLSVAFIPIFSKLLIEDKNKANRIASSVLNFSFLTMLAICFGLFWLAEPLTKALVPGFTGQKLSDTIQLTRLFLLSPVIFTVSNIFTSMLNAQKRFIIVGLAPIMYNLGIIFGLLVFYKKFGVIGLGFGVILGAILHLCLQIPQVFALGFRWSAVIDFKEKAFQQMARLFIPKIFGLDNSQISLLIGSVIGSLLASGSIAVLNLANNLQAVPLGIFAISISIAAFPALSENFAKKDEVGFLKTLEQGIIQILFFIVPISILLLILRAHLVRLVYGAGEFNWTDTILTYKTLGIFAVSLFAQSLSPLLARSFYARQNTIIPVIINLFTMALNAGLSYRFALAYGYERGVLGIALGFSVASVFQLLVLATALNYFLKKSPGIVGLSSTNNAKTSLPVFYWNILQNTGKIIGMSLAAGTMCYGTLYALEHFVKTETGLGLLIQSGSAALTGTIIYLLAGSALNFAQAKKFFKLAGL